MNGFIRPAAAAAFLLAGLAATGCTQYRNWVDPCYPQRYTATARREVIDAFSPQVQNGHVLDQTIWAYHFDKGTDRLNKMGEEKLKYLARRRPQPDANLFLATANDFEYDPNNVEATVEARRELDSKRVASVQRFLSERMAGRPMEFTVLVHDPYPVGISGPQATGNNRLVNAASASGPLGGLMGTSPNSGGPGGANTQGGNATGQLSGGTQVQPSSGGNAAGGGTSAMPR